MFEDDKKSTHVKNKKLFDYNFACNLLENPMAFAEDHLKLSRRRL